MPKVSVCIPTYNQTIYLKKCIDSLLMQSFTDYEIIISDDSSNNEVKNYIESLNVNCKLSYFHHSPSLGSPANWNYSISQATGEFIKILHHDDFFTNSESLKTFVDLLEKNPESDFAFSATHILNNKTRKISKHHCSEKNLINLIKLPGILFFENLIGAPSSIIYRNNNNILFDTRFKWLVDIDFYISHLTKNKKIMYTSLPLITTLNGGEGQITGTVINNKEIQIREHVLLFEKLFNELELRNGFNNYFTELFLNYKLNTVADLEKVVPLSSNLLNYFTVFFKTLHTNYILKKVKFRLLNSLINLKYIHIKGY